MKEKKENSEDNQKNNKSLINHEKKEVNELSIKNIDFLVN